MSVVLNLPCVLGDTKECLSVFYTARGNHRTSNSGKLGCTCGHVSEDRQSWRLWVKQWEKIVQIHWADCLPTLIIHTATTTRITLCVMFMQEELRQKN